MANQASTTPFAATRTRLLVALGWAAVWVVGLALVAGALWGFHITQDMLLGAMIVLLPSVWVALSLTSGSRAFSPVWMGLARFGLAALGFAALFAVRPDSGPTTVLAGSALALALPPVWLHRLGRASSES